MTVGVVVVIGCSGSDDDGGASTLPEPPRVESTVSPTAPSSNASSSIPTPPNATTSSTLTLNGPDALAAELTTVEAGIRDPARSAEELAALGRRQQQAFRALADRPEWDEQVISLVAPEHQESVRWTIRARQAVVAHSATRAPSEPPTTLPAWTIAPPLPADELLALYRSAEDRTGVSWAYLAAINFVETRMGRIVGASPDGALGPMQFLPTTWAQCCTGDITDPADAILGAATYLRTNGAPDDMPAALAAYNPNAGYVGAVDAYARNLLADERALFGYHGWEVYVSTAIGAVRLPVGYSTDLPLDVATYVAEHPEAITP